MQKIPTIYLRDPANPKLLLDTPHPDCDWVFRGEGVARRKFDGSCCRIKNGVLWKRREVKKGKTPPEGFELAAHDTITGKTVGWLPVDPTSAEDQWHREALCKVDAKDLFDGTYELIGPKVQGNAEKWQLSHKLVSHIHAWPYLTLVRTRRGIVSALKQLDIEGFVFHHPDGRMAKIKQKDFGLSRNRANSCHLESRTKLAAFRAANQLNCE